MASKGHLYAWILAGAGSSSIQCCYFLTQIPQPMHRNSEMKAILSVDLTSMQSFPEISYRSNFPYFRPPLTHFDDGT
ncbi:hypothetical protein C8F04DRAFT_982247 [Mycena alexandri]|uniref:Uncharacterized protein n=1 Tax=Mycena alexandri TaxID=1745969 RepID=A0AAD6WK39_9AGAR|nr:hypothetical protein C8F04DRAFT_982247 [Mycena alexandri]